MQVLSWPVVQPIADATFSQLLRTASAKIVIEGAHDAFVTPDHARRIAASLPNARLVMVSGGHMSPYAHPALVAAAVRELLAPPATRPRALRARERARSAAR